MRENMLYDTNKYQLRDYVIYRMAELVKQVQSSKQGGTVFFGDSLTEYFDVNKHMDIDHVYNCGIAGITSDMLLHFIDEGVIKYQPSSVFIMIGTNDLGNTIMASPRDIALNVKEMIEIIHYNLPTCQIHLIGCIPCLESLHGYKASHAGLRSNDILQMVEAEYKRIIPYDYVHHIHVYDALCDDQGHPIESYYQDGLHINEEGYKQYAKAIKEQL